MTGGMRHTREALDRLFAHRQGAALAEVERYEALAEAAREITFAIWESNEDERAAAGRFRAALAALDSPDKDAA